MPVNSFQIGECMSQRLDVLLVFIEVLISSFSFGNLLRVKRDLGFVKLAAIIGMPSPIEIRDTGPATIAADIA